MQVHHSQSCALCQSQSKQCCSIAILFLWVIPRVATSSNGFHQMQKHPANANTKETHIFLPTYHCMSIFSIVPASVFLTWLRWSRWLWRCLAVVVLQSMRGVLNLTILLFAANFTTEPALSNKLLLVSLVLGYKALKYCADALYRGIPCTFVLIYPFAVLLLLQRV